MSDDPNPALRQELNDALAVLNPELRGLHDYAAMQVGSDLLVAVNAQLNSRTRRQLLIQAVINALDNVVTQLGNLQADGYPALPQVPLAGSAWAELQQSSADLTAAAGIFGTQASQLIVNLGSPADKPAGE